VSNITSGIISYAASVWFISLVLAFYIVLGGFKAVVWTDALQVIILGLCVVLTFIVVIAHFGWCGVFIRAAEARGALFKAPGPVPIYTMKLWVSQLLFIGLGFVFIPQLWVRIYSVSDTKGLQKIVTYFVSWTAVIFFIGFFLAVVAAPIIKELFPAGEKIVPDQIIIKLMFNSMGPALAATLLTGAVAASMSTIDSGVLAISSILTIDLYAKQRTKPTEAKKQVLIGRVISVVLIAIMAVLAFYPVNLLFNSLIDFAYPGLLALTPATILGLYWRRASKSAALASILVGSIVAVIILLVKINPMGIYTGFWTFMASLITFVVVTAVVPSKEEIFLPDTVKA